VDADERLIAASTDDAVESARTAGVAATDSALRPTVIRQRSRGSVKMTWSPSCRGR
jgi:hypothetical protein